MFCFYNVLKEHPADQPITQEEIDIASGKKTMDPKKVTEYVKNLEVMSENIIRAFEKQGAAAAVCGPS
jgi:hypothetical protein